MIFNLKFSMDVSSINITARMCSQAMLIQFPRSAPLSAPVALYTPFKFCTFLFFVTKSRIFGPNTSGVENTPNFLSFNVIRNPALLDIGRWTLNILCLNIGHWTWGIGDETMDMSHWHWTLDIGNLPLLDGSCLPLDPLQGGKPPPSVPAALPAIIILTYLNVAQPLHSRCTTFPHSLHNIWTFSVKVFPLENSSIGRWSENSGFVVLWPSFWNCGKLDRKFNKEFSSWSLYQSCLGSKLYLVFALKSFTHKVPPRQGMLNHWWLFALECLLGKKLHWNIYLGICCLCLWLSLSFRQG